MEQIYTIPVNETFEAFAGQPDCGCPLCKLHRRLEENELERILGAALMDPDVRIQTNEEGFCPVHYDLMLQRQNRLGMTLMLESHMQQLQKEIADTPLSHGGKRAVSRISNLEKTCHICQRLDGHFSKVIETVVLLWQREPEFPAKLQAQKMICLPHYKALLDYAQKRLSHKEIVQFAKQLETIVQSYMTELNGDISWFCKKFDYRYNDAPWGNAKDAPERAVKFLSSDLHPHPGEFRKDSGGLR